MSQAPSCRVLAIMGSGETSPTMVTAHKAIVARLGAGQHSAALLDTPYAFQENAAEISSRAQDYFERSVGLTVSVATGDGAAAAVRAADWVFAGPGSPSYALNRWRGGPVAQALLDRVAGGTGITLFASAAAASMGLVAIPVYEIYKVGADPHWLEGLDLLSVLGLRVAVIPHYDNAEGGTHDTRFCYLGERRLAMLEPDLPDDAAVLGVDEHTALVFDLLEQRADVTGRGGVTVRKRGESLVFPAGSVIGLDDLRALVRTGLAGRAVQAGHGTAASPAAANPEPARPAMLLPDQIEDATRRFDTAVDDRDSTTLVAAILDLDEAVQEWATDTDENSDADRARAVLRGMISRLGKLADGGLADPGDRVRPAIEPLLKLRDQLRQDGNYAAADVIRDALVALGVELHDSPDGTTWALAGQRLPALITAI